MYSKEMKNDTIVHDTSFIQIVSLHPQEVQLLNSLRNNWRFGEITILMREGLPYRLRRIMEFIDLNE